MKTMNYVSYPVYNYTTWGTRSTLKTTVKGMMDTLHVMYGREKSFYGKAHVIATEKAVYLVSYETIVCKIEDNKLVKLWGGYSDTTKRHINEFIRQYGHCIETLNKKQWENLEKGDY